MIRPGMHSDLKAILELANKAGDLTPYAHLPRDRQSMVQVITQCIASRFSFCEVAEHEGKLTGVLLAQAAELWFSKKRAATDILFYCESGDGAFMAKRYIDWGWRTPNVVEVSLAQSSGIDMDRFADMCELIGMQLVGTVFTLIKPAEPARAVG